MSVEEREIALNNLLTEIVQCLCYQPEFPMEHKNDMVKALNKYLEAKSALERARE